MYFIVSVLVLGLLIFVHELGHFLVAKYYKVGVIEFAIGFGKKIWKKQIGETTYSIGIIPLGGYVRMVGDDPSLLNPNETEDKKEVAEETAKKSGVRLETLGAEAEVSETEKALLADKSRWFLSQPYWPKFLIVLAGPAFNVFFAIILAIVTIFFYGFSIPVDKPIIGNVIPGFPAAESGLKAGDQVKSVNGKIVNTWSELAQSIASSPQAEVALIINRKSENLVDHALTVKGSTAATELDTLEGRKTDGRVRIGIVAPTEEAEASFTESLQYGVLHVWHLTKVTLRGLKGMIMGDISPKNIAGPIFIFSEAASRAEKGVNAVFDFMIILSVSLAILNLLPIPVLDGGHIMFFTIEALRGRPLGLRWQQVANQIGVMLLFLLMLFAVSNDVLRSFGGL